jgi:hypothetical protein
MKFDFYSFNKHMLLLLSKLAETYSLTFSFCHGILQNILEPKVIVMEIFVFVSSANAHMNFPFTTVEGSVIFLCTYYRGVT